MRLIFFYLFSGIFLPIFCWGQYPIWLPVEGTEDQSFEQLHTDTLGFIWALSKQGLFKYDGYDLVKKVATTTPRETFESIDFSSNDFYNIGTSDGSIISYQPYQDKVINRLQKGSEKAINALYCFDLHSDCIITQYGHGLQWTSAQRDTFLTVENILISNEVYEAAFFENNLVLATDQGLQILQLNDKNISSRVISATEGLQDIIITNIAIQGNFIWVSNFDQLISKIDLSTAEIQTFPFTTKSKINDVQWYSKNLLVVSRDDGLYFLENDQWQKKYPLDDSSAKIYSTDIDEEGNIWISQHKKGLFKAALNFQKIDLPIKQIQSILKTTSNLYLGTKSGLHTYQNGQLQKILDENITCLVEAFGLIWVGTYSSGLYVLNNDGQFIKKIDGWENHSGQSILYLLPTSDRIYISSLTGVTVFPYVFSKNKLSIIAPTSLNDRLGQGYTYQILAEGDQLYFATDQQGLKVLNANELQHFTHFQDSTEIGSVFSMVLDAQQTLWIASSEGNLAYLQNGQFIQRNDISNPNDIYTSLIKLNNNNLMMIRSGSVDVFNPASDQILYFNKELGIINVPPFLNTFSVNNSDVWFAHDQEIYRYSNISTLKKYPEVIIDKIAVNLSTVLDQINFKQDENNFQFAFTGSWMTAPEQLSYQYTLEGFDRDLRITKDRTVSYPKLPPGAYVFKVRASQDGVFAQQPFEEFHFRIKKHFYNTWLFWICCISLSFYLFQKWRRNRQKNRRQKAALEKQQIESQLISLQSQLNPHFLFNSFNTLIGLIEEDPAKGIIFTEKLTDFYRSILQVGKRDLIPLSEEIHLLQSFIHLLRQRFDQQLFIDIEVEKENESLIPPLTLQLLVENAVKHNVVSTKSPLHIQIQQQGDLITISNNLHAKLGKQDGIGIGLKNISRRYELNKLPAPIIKNGPEQFIVTIALKSTSNTD